MVLYWGSFGVCSSDHHAMKSNSTNGLDKIDGVVQPEHCVSRHFKVGRHFYDAQFQKKYTFLKVEISKRVLHIDHVPSILSNATHRFVRTVRPHPVARPPVEVKDDDQAGDVEGDLDQLALLVVRIVGFHIVVVHEEADFAFLQRLRKFPLDHVGDRKDCDVLGV